MTGFTNQNLTNGILSFAEDDIAYHCITTDNKYMADIGLSSFTLGQLYNWMSKRNSFGEFINLKYFGIPGLSRGLSQSETIESRILGGKLGQILFGDPPSTDKDWLYFYKWEKKNRTGEYIKTNYYNWKYYNKYIFADIEFQNWSDRFVELKRQAGADPYSIIFTPILSIDNYISNLVALNDYSRLLPILKDFYVDDKLPKSALAAHEFIMDIKTSQHRCIEWSSIVKFASPVTQSFSCVKEETVNFKLYLYDFTNPKNSNRGVAFNGDNLYITLPRKDEFDRFSRNDGSGEFDFPEIDPELASRAKVASQLAATVNPSDGKAYSGSPTILVRLDTELPAAQGPDYATDSTVPQEIDPQTAIAPGLGTAIPIKEQNGNPLQWASQYAEQRCKRNTKKFTINVKNFSKTFIPSGVLGYATKIMGESGWSFIPIGNYDADVDRSPSDWAFTYLMMNFDNFFTSRWTDANSAPGAANPTGRYNAKEYEESVRKYYYGESDQPRYEQILDNFAPIQITSWDFMDPSIGGSRIKGNSLSNTIFQLTNTGDPWPDFEGGVYSTPFFGCVFPAGYDTLGKNYFQLTSRNMKVKSSGHADVISFIHDIDAGTKIFNNSQNDAFARGEEFVKGIFCEGPLQSTLNHLPADIATNSFESPLINYYHIYEAFQKTPSGQLSTVFFNKTEYQDNISKIIGSNYRNKYIWLHEEGKPNVSTFGFKPINSYKIQFRPLRHEVYDSFQKHDYPIGTQNPEFGYELGTFARITRNYQKSNDMPMHVGVIYRNKWLTTPWPDSNNNMGMIDADGSIRYNMELFRLNNLRGFGEGARFPFLWRANWLAKNPERGSGAIGVIGASYTVSLQSSITFNTNSIFGMRSSFGPTNILIPRPWYASIGGYGNNYDSMHNTQLYVRIFHHWPKKYTIYDPAKFAIFHFNTDDDNLNNIQYWKNDRAPLQNDDLVCADSIISNSVVEKIQLQTKIDDFRKEKLLPCTYTMQYTIGLDVSATYIVGQTSGPTIAKFYGVVIDNQGSGYSETDTFKVVGGNGTSPILSPSLDPTDEKITGFKYQLQLPTDKGYGYKQSDFLKADDNFLVNDGGLQIIPISANGTGFSGRIVRGVGTETTQTDPKPKYVGEEFLQLTPNIPVQDSQSSTIVEPVTGSRTQTVQIFNKSKDGKYDIFLHFHNDTSHTLTYSDGASGPALENYVELEILPN